MWVFAILVVDRVLIVAVEEVEEVESCYYYLSTDGQLPEILAIQIQARFNGWLGNAGKGKS